MTLLVKVGLGGRGTTGLIPMIELEDEELDSGEVGHEGAKDTDLVAIGPNYLDSVIRQIRVF